MTKFSFLEESYPELFKICELSEKLIEIDPSSCLGKSRLFSEKLASLIWEFEDLNEFQGTQAERIQQLYYRNIIPDVVKDLLHQVRLSGNKATHVGNSSKAEALFILKKCFQLARWFYETYENEYIEVTDYQLPQKKEDKSVEKLQGELERLSVEVKNYQEKIASFNANDQVREDRKKRAVVNANNIHKSESETRELIDEQLRNAGWQCDTEVLNYKKHKTLPEKGKFMAIAEWPCDSKYADYALFIGKTLYGLVEAKKYAKDISTNLGQPKVYAECIKNLSDIEFLKSWGNFKVPFLFSTNGRSYLEQLKTKSGIWFLDIRNKRNQSKALRGWYSPEGLQEIYKRDVEEADKKLEDSDIGYLQSRTGLSLRDYQIEAISSIEQKIANQPKDPRSLLVMATGTGKTRTTIGLTYRLIKSNRFKRILFLTDRTLLAQQALGSFQDNKVEDINTFSAIYQIEEMKERFPDTETRLHFATVQSMVKRLFYNEENPIPIDTYDCIIIDEAHRGYNLDRELDEDDLNFKDENDYVSQYKRVIEYFDAYLIGLTATPALHTKEIFGKPVFSYSYRQAVIDGFLVDHEPPYLIKTKLSEEGMLWKKGDKPKVYISESNTIEELSELEDEMHIEIEHFNKMVITEAFNREIIKQLVKEIDPEGDEKTLIFAVRDSHADMIVKMLYEEYAELGSDLQDGTIEKITGNRYDPSDLTKRFKNEKFPTIAVTVDLLTTGIDVPQITNLVFLRRVKSRILFEQMIGRATRLCDDIGKEFFKIYDAVRVYEALEDYTQMKTVSKPSTSFKKLAEELEIIDTPERAKQQLEEIVAKMQRKKRKLNDDQLEHFAYLSGGQSPDELISAFKQVKQDEVKKIISEYKGLWNFLDTKVYQPKLQYVSDHKDEFVGIERGYGKAEKPEDYIEGFRKFIEENRNKISALNIVCTKPESLSRESLKELKLLLDEQGYSAVNLNTAWKQTKNVEIAADIISYIRTMALNTSLLNHEERIKKAVSKIKESRDWNKIQLRWLDRFEAQLIKETIITKDDLDKEPFRKDGGYKRLNKIFENNLDEVLDKLNDNLYSAS
ncbi:type I restriction enzyme, R subunit [Zunongwangia mangrovi]|uniref:Type I restriction enzyme, R subunit n=1 Tax=Zunongwangia mangrovi TaxID=1334022 RepID=A0A1I1J196_9FLAO|nr:type I restriction-modification system endonuclease [Zunongwangia mangrovi]SFC39230.1 type I restriction enzyme, R subunit [Zunongwangia mangrovi]